MERNHKFTPLCSALLAFYAGGVGTIKLSLSSTIVRCKPCSDINLREDLKFIIFLELNGASPVSPEKGVGNSIFDT